ncbi:17-beta-hydroxysteroid dehydrogenase type 1 isoform X1 [Struthio camelus]|uniref:17-beta-hydroxysteroid dehydrogenase type 1 isoform X1 n=1 Tax=Struthio camelus TaxID=8801 RepID=UPI003603DF7F
MEKTTVLITGCSSGIGLALATRLASDAAQRFKGKGVRRRPRGCGPRGGRRGAVDEGLPGAARRRLVMSLGSGPAAPGGRSLAAAACGRALSRSVRHRARPGQGRAAAGAPGRLPGRRAGGPAARRHRPALAGRGRGPAAGAAARRAGVQRRRGPDGPLGDLLRASHEERLRREPLRGRPHHPGLPARHEAPQGREDRRLQQHRGAARWGGSRPAGCVAEPGRPRGSGSRGEAARLSGRCSAPGVPFNAVYCASKFAVEGLCESLAMVLQPFDVHVTLVECGPVNTSFLANARRPEPEGAELRGLDAETRRLYRRYLRHCQGLFGEAAQDVEEVVQVFVEALCSPRPPLRCVTTQRFAPLARLRLASPDGSDFLRAVRAFVFGGDQA